MEDDDEEDDKGISAVRYPVMPSLVALQQMNNRLHLAFLGKKLMKWTAQATRRELRRLAEEIDAKYKSFAEDTRNAYILLARARYFYPNLNKMVLGNFPQTASITVRSTNKSIAGVKVVQTEILDTSTDSYPCLGIDKGGQKIDEAKEEWKKLLRRMIVILQLRCAFSQVEAAHKTATKRGMVLRRIIIPKVRATITYISFGLEEMSREDTYRLKMIQKLSKKRKQGKEIKVCEVCQEEICGGKETEEPETIDICADTCQGTETAKETQPEVPKIVSDIVKIPEIPKVSELAKPETCACSDGVIKTAKKDPQDQKIEELKQRLQDVIILSKHILDKDVSNEDMVRFLKSCEEIKSRIDTIVVSKEPDGVKEPYTSTSSKPCRQDICKSKTCPMKAKQNKLTEVKNQIEEVIKTTEEYRQEGFLTPSTENFLKICKHVKGNIEKHMKGADKIDHLKKQIQELEELVVDAKEEGLKATMMEDFESSCRDFEFKLEQRSCIQDDEDDDIILMSIGDDLTKILDWVLKGVLTKSTEKLIRRLEAQINAQEEGEMLYSPCSMVCSCDDLSTQTNSQKGSCSSCSTRASPGKTSSKSKISQKSIDGKLDKFRDKYSCPAMEASCCESSTNKSIKSCPSGNSCETVNTSASKLIRKITKVTRIEHVDGSVNEQKEFITISVDGENGPSPNDSLLGHHGKLKSKSTKNQNKGCCNIQNVTIRLIRSESDIKKAMTNAVLRSCTSFTDFTNSNEDDG